LITTSAPELAVFNILLHLDIGVFIIHSNRNTILA
jgi:hypothetical protein